MDAEADENGRIDYDMYRWSFEDPSEKVFRDIAKRLKKVAKLKRNRRHDTVECATTFFATVVQDPELAEKLDDCLDSVLDAVAVISESLFNLLEEGDEIYVTASEFNSNVCLLLEQLQESLNADNFVRQTAKLYVFYLDLAIENPHSWLHTLVTAGPMELISLTFASVENKDLVIDDFKSQMLQIHKAITYCGDFECQRSLLVALIAYLTHAHVKADVKSAFLRGSFTLLPRQYRKILLRDFTLYDVDYKARYFLNVLNKELSKSCRPTSIYSISCSNVFLDGERIKPPQHLDVREFWVDFSCKSKRIHFYSSCSNEDEWRTNSFRKDQIDSLCIFYPSKPNETQITDGTGYVDNTQASEMTQQNDNPVIYIHFLLVDGVDHLSVFSETTSSNKKSLVFEFKNLEKVEKALEFFQFDTHECDVETYKRLVPPPPRDSEDTLRSQTQARLAVAARFVEEMEHSDYEAPIPAREKHAWPDPVSATHAEVENAALEWRRFSEEMEVENSDQESPTFIREQHAEVEAGRAEIEIFEAPVSPASSNDNGTSIREQRAEPETGRAEIENAFFGASVSSASSNGGIKNRMGYRKPPPRHLFSDPKRRRKHTKKTQMPSREPTSTIRIAPAAAAKTSRMVRVLHSGKSRVPCWKRTPPSSPEPDFSDPYNLVAVMKYHEAKEKARKKQHHI